MNTKTLCQSIVLATVLILGNANAADFPGNSVYQLESHWRTQNNTDLPLTEMADQVQIVAFVYTYCKHTCPLIIAKLQAIDKEMSASLKEQSHITLISLDPERDTPEVLKSYMQEHKLDEKRWTMLQGDSDTTQELAAVLGTRYRPMGQDDIAHSNTLTVLDRSGVVVYQSKGISEPTVDIVNEIEKASVL